jgi:hypothetical protein
MILASPVSLLMGWVLGMIPGALCTYFIVRRGEAFYSLAECMDNIKRKKKGKL